MRVRVRVRVTVTVTVRARARVRVRVAERVARVHAVAASLGQPDIHRDEHRHLGEI